MSETQGISNKEKNFFSERTFEINGETLTLFFPEPGLKISKEKKQSISRRNWENIVLNLHKRVVEGIDKESAHDTKVFSGDEPNLDQIKEEVNRVLKSLKTQITPQDEEFLRYLEKSFRAKIKYLERMRNLEEICASNSGWLEFVDALKGKAYHDLSLNFVQNFTTPVILDLKATIRDQVNKLVDSEAGDYDRELAVATAESKILDVLTNYIIRESRENILRLIRENKGGLRNLIITALKNQKKGMEEVNNLDEVVNRFILQIAPYLKNKSGNIIRLPTEETDSRKRTKGGLLLRIQDLFNGRDRLKKFRDRALNAVASGILVMAMTGSSIASFQESQQKVETPPPVLIEGNTLPIIPVSPDLQIALSNLDPEVVRSYPELNKDDFGNTQEEETPKIPPEEIDSRNTLEVLAQTPTEEMPNNDKKQEEETKGQKPTFFDEKIDMLLDQQCLALLPQDINKDGEPDVIILDYPKNGDLTPLCQELMGLENVYQSLPGAGDRIHVFFRPNVRPNEKIPLFAVKQTPASCVLHAYFMGITLLKHPEHQGKPLIINPFLIAEAINLGPDEYEKLLNELEKNPSMSVVYGNELKSASLGGSINLAIQREKNPEFNQFLLKNGIILLPDISLQRLPPIPDKENNYFMPKSMFEEDDWNKLIEKFPHIIHTEFIGNDYTSGNPQIRQIEKLVLPREIAEKYYASYLARHYKDIKGEYPEKSVVFMSLKSDASGMRHQYLILEIKEVKGELYFRAIEGRAGGPANWPFYQGKIIRQSDGSILIPLKDIAKWYPSFEIMSSTSILN